MMKAAFRRDLGETVWNKNGGRMDFDAHERLLDRIRITWPGSIHDGAVDPARYASARPRILWILREAHGGHAWDLRKMLRTDEELFKVSRWAATYGNVARVSHGFLYGMMPWGDWGDRNARTMTEALRQIAVINRKKTSGGRRIAPARFRRECAPFTEVVREQIELLQPDVIIAGGTGDLIPNHSAQAVVVSPYHPQQSSIDRRGYYEWILTRATRQSVDSPSS